MTQTPLGNYHMLVLQITPVYYSERRSSSYEFIWEVPQLQKAHVRMIWAQSQIELRSSGRQTDTSVRVWLRPLSVSSRSRRKVTD